MSGSEVTKGGPTRVEDAKGHTLQGKFAELLAKAEGLKKEADLAFGRGKYEEAITIYSNALNELVQQRGGSMGESCAIKCFANQAACLIKLKDYTKATQALEVAISIPTANVDLHMYSKLWHRRALCQQYLENLPQALYSLDRAIGILPGNEEFLSFREKLLDEITSKHGIVPIPDIPTGVSADEIEAHIKDIFQLGGQYEVILPRLTELNERRCNLDTHTENQYNLMWAVCQVAIMRTTQGIKLKAKRLAEMKEGETVEQVQAIKDVHGDDVYPILEFLIKNGAKAEQRYIKDGNKTPLQMMCLAGAVKCAKLLLSTGATVYIVDDNLWSPLLVACSPTGPYASRNSAMVKLLLDHKAPVNHTNIAGIHALSLACQGGDIKTVRLLIENSCKINLRCNMGFSPIVWTKIACRNKAAGAEILKLLLQSGEALVKEMPQLLKEMQEDIKCVDSSNVLLSLSQKLDELEAKPIVNSSNAVAAPEKVVLETLLKMLGIPPEMLESDDGILLLDPKDKTKCNNIYEMIYVHVLSLLPNSFHKKWRSVSVNDAEPVNAVTTMTIEDTEIADIVHKAHPLEQFWLNILLTAAQGPDPKKPLPLIDIIHSRKGHPVDANGSTDVEEDKFYQNRFYKHYTRGIENILTHRFSPVVPINSTCDYIISNHPSVLCLDYSDFWSKLLSLYHKSDRYLASTKDVKIESFEAQSVTYPNTQQKKLAAPGASSSSIKKSQATDFLEKISSMSAIPSSPSLLFIYDYTDNLVNNKDFAVRMIQAYHGNEILLYEVFFDYSALRGSKINEYTNAEVNYMPTLLRSAGYISKEFSFASAVSGGSSVSVTLSAKSDGEKPDSPTSALPSTLNSEGVYVISSPAWIYKRAMLSVWKKL